MMVGYQRAFENIFQMLRPGGLFVFSEFFIHGESIRIQQQVNRSLNEIEAIMKKTGFRVKARVPMFALMNYPIDTKSNIFKISWQWMMLPVREHQSWGLHWVVYYIPLS